MLSNLLLIIEIAVISLTVILGIYSIFRASLNKKYPAVIKLPQGDGDSEVSVYSLSKNGGMHYNKYIFKVVDGRYSGRMVLESILLVVGYILALNALNLWLYADFGGLKVMMTVYTLLPTFVFLSLFCRGKRQAYAALKKHLRDKGELKDGDILYDTKSAQKMCIGGLEHDGLKTYFPMIPSKDILKIEKAAEDTKLFNFLKRKKIFNIVFAVTFVIMAIGAIFFHSFEIWGIAFMLMFVEAFAQEPLGLLACPYCYQPFGRGGATMYCAHCQKPLTSQTKWLNEFTEEEAEEEDEKIKEIREEMKEIKDKMIVSKL